MSEENNKITLYPSNWLYNAGVLGFLQILEKYNKGQILEITNQDGTIKQKIFDIIQAVFSQENNELQSVLKHLSFWHWNFIELSFINQYKSIQELVEKSLRYSENSTRRGQIKKQLQVKNINYENQTCDFTNINKGVNDIFAQAFGKKSTIDFITAKSKLIDEINTHQNEYIYKKTIGSLFAKGGLYQNKFNPNDFSNVKKFANTFNMDKIIKHKRTNEQCSFCSNSFFNILSIKSTDMNNLFPSFKQFPNAFWNNEQSQSTTICSLCNFFIMHHHLALIKLSDKSEIFINAPSFKVMYELNKFAKEAYGNKTTIEARTKREILATSVIEYTNKIQTSLGIWAGMNIEIVTKKKDSIEFFSIPYNVIKLITDRRIAEILSDLGEYNIYNKILDENFTDLINISQKLLRLSTKEQLSKNEKSVVNSLLSQWKNQKKLTQTANKILKLYSLIEDKNKRS